MVTYALDAFLKIQKTAAVQQSQMKATTASTVDTYANSKKKRMAVPQSTWEAAGIWGPISGY